MSLISKKWINKLTDMIFQVFSFVEKFLENNTNYAKIGDKRSISTYMKKMKSLSTENDDLMKTIPIRKDSPWRLTNERFKLRPKNRLEKFQMQSIFNVNEEENKGKGKNRFI